MNRALILGALASAGLAGAACADVLNIDISGWATFGGYGNTGNNSVTITLPVGSTIDSASVSNFSATANGASYQSEITLSLNDGPTGDYWDMAPGTTNAPGSFSGNFVWGVAPSAGGAFTLTTGSLFVTAYEGFTDGELPDGNIHTGFITINYTVPTPGAAALMGMGLIASARRRRA